MKVKNKLCTVICFLVAGAREMFTEALVIHISSNCRFTETLVIHISSNFIFTETLVIHISSDFRFT